MATENAEILEQLGRRYDAGFITDIESDSLPPGLDEDVVRALSAKKNEPEWMTEWRLAAYRHWLTMPAPHRMLRPWLSPPPLHRRRPNRKRNRKSSKASP